MRLYEQYRPSDLSQVLGQPKAVAACQSLIARKALGGQAVWISGMSGTGKTTLARILAKAAGGTNVTTTEYDSADRVGQAELDNMTREFGLRSLYGARVWIINEAHGLRANIIRQLLGLLERLPSDALMIFTTTKDGQADLFEDKMDAGPLLSRCLQIPLTNQGVQKAFAQRALEIARENGLDGQPLERYERLAKDCHGNMREMLQRVESGQMLA
jgi:replication-associated recombination protein RarA